MSETNEPTTLVADCMVYITLHDNGDGRRPRIVVSKVHQDQSYELIGLLEHSCILCMVEKVVGADPGTFH